MRVYSTRKGGDRCAALFRVVLLASLISALRHTCSFSSSRMALSTRSHGERSTQTRRRQGNIHTDMLEGALDVVADRDIEAAKDELRCSGSEPAILRLESLCDRLPQKRAKVANLQGLWQQSFAAASMTPFTYWDWPQILVDSAQTTNLANPDLMVRIQGSRAKASLHLPVGSHNIAAQLMFDLTDSGCNEIRIKARRVQSSSSSFSLKLRMPLSFGHTVHVTYLDDDLLILRGAANKAVAFWRMPRSQTCGDDNKTQSQESAKMVDAGSSIGRQPPNEENDEEEVGHDQGVDAEGRQIRMRHPKHVPVVCIRPDDAPPHAAERIKLLIPAGMNSKELWEVLGSKVPWAAGRQPMIQDFELPQNVSMLLSALDNMHKSGDEFLYITFKAKVAGETVDCDGATGTKHDAAAQDGSGPIVEDENAALEGLDAKVETVAAQVAEGAQQSWMAQVRAAKAMTRASALELRINQAVREFEAFATTQRAEGVKFKSRLQEQEEAFWMLEKAVKEAAEEAGDAKLEVVETDLFRMQARSERQFAEQLAEQAGSLETLEHSMLSRLAEVQAMILARQQQSFDDQHLVFASAELVDQTKEFLLQELKEVQADLVTQHRALVHAVDLLKSSKDQLEEQVATAQTALSEVEATHKEHHQDVAAELARFREMLENIEERLAAGMSDEYYPQEEQVALLDGLESVVAERFDELIGEIHEIEKQRFRETELSAQLYQQLSERTRQQEADIRLQQEALSKLKEREENRPWAAALEERMEASLQASVGLVTTKQDQSLHIVQADLEQLRNMLVDFEERIADTAQDQQNGHGHTMEMLAALERATDKRLAQVEERLREKLSQQLGERQRDTNLLEQTNALENSLQNSNERVAELADRVDEVDEDVAEARQLLREHKQVLGTLQDERDSRAGLEQVVEEQVHNQLQRKHEDTLASLESVVHELVNPSHEELHGLFKGVQNEVEQQRDSLESLEQAATEHRDELQKLICDARLAKNADEKIMCELEEQRQAVARLEALAKERLASAESRSKRELEMEERMEAAEARAEAMMRKLEDLASIDSQDNKRKLEMELRLRASEARADDLTRTLERMISSDDSSKRELKMERRLQAAEARADDLMHRLDHITEASPEDITAVAQVVEEISEAIEAVEEVAEEEREPIDDVGEAASANDKSAKGSPKRRRFWPFR